MFIPNMAKKIFIFSKISFNSASIIMKILNKFLIDEKNGEQILKYLNKTENFSISEPTMLKILQSFRRVIAHYIRDIYRFHKLGKSDGSSLIDVDESEFVKQNPTKLWVF